MQIAYYPCLIFSIDGKLMVRNLQNTNNHPRFTCLNENGLGA